MTIYLLGLDLLEYLSSQVQYLFDEFLSQIFEWHLIKILKFLFIGKRSYHGATFTLLEVALQCAPHLILLIISLALLSKCSL